jgi:hypothetical protein
LWGGNFRGHGEQRSQRVWCSGFCRFNPDVVGRNAKKEGLACADQQRRDEDSQSGYPAQSAAIGRRSHAARSSDSMAVCQCCGSHIS